MNESTAQIDTATTNVSVARYSKVSTFHTTPPTQSTFSPDQITPIYMKGYRSGNKNHVVITYNGAEEYARSVRRQINKLLNA